MGNRELGIGNWELGIGNWELRIETYFIFWKFFNTESPLTTNYFLVRLSQVILLL
jgi:hypothetical protein